MSFIAANSMVVAINLTNRFRFNYSVRVYCYRSQMTSQRGKKQKSAARDEVKCRDFFFFPRYGVFIDLLQYIRMLKRNLFALYIKDGLHDGINLN